MASDPTHPLVFSSPPNPVDTEDSEGHSYGHLWGALIQIMPYEALTLVGGGDQRFRGWGGEDEALMHSLDALYAVHKNTPNQVLHVWHKRLRGIPTNNGALRVWEGQADPRSNDDLASRYRKVRRDPEAMQLMIDERPKSWLTWWRRIG